jgi:nitrate reductase delta subunit
VTTPGSRQPVLDAFASLLSYPSFDPAPVARWCAGLLSGRGESSRHLARFLARAESAGPHEMEELYSSTFDLDPACAPYVGHHLCGESPQRGVFMARLADVYRKDGFRDGRPGGELPDHLSVVLRYLAEVPSGPDRQALLEDGLVPALDRMLASPLDPENPYRSLLAALREEVSP